MTSDVDMQKYLHLHADCIPVRGANRSAIYDVGRREITLFPTSYFDLLLKIRDRRLCDIFNIADASTQWARANEFINFLLDSEFADLIDDPAQFPEINDSWDAPTKIHNAVIDVDTQMHDFSLIFSQLDQLGCRFVQIRCYSDLISIANIAELLTPIKGTSIEGVELIIKYQHSTTRDQVKDIIYHNPSITGIIFHSSPFDKNMIDGSSDRSWDLARSALVFFTR
jgi:SPASM domain peptide maturase of grasp-with-spasm system